MKRLNLKHITGIFKKNKGAHKKGDTPITGLWLWVLLGSFIAALILLGASSLLFIRVLNGESSLETEVDVEGVASINKEELSAMLELLRTQKEEFGAVRVDGVNLVDPSL